MHAPWPTLIVAVSSLLSGAAAAQVYSGRLDDAANTALVGSDLGAAQFGSPAAIADNVALIELLVPVAGAVAIVSTGQAAGGIDPYFTLFQGSGSGATFLASNADQAFSSGGDFSYAATLAAGRYEIALGTFANMSFAENLGSGTLADGFTALGTPAALGDASYRLVVTVPVPEPPAWALIGFGGIALLSRRGRQALRQAPRGNASQPHRR
ncbi:MAG: DVUA0089 family protein [Burkholderiales bacterium]|nr:DVUA0089 family protein [Burkholderiales bacterium]